MEEDRQSVATSAGMILTHEQLCRKLSKTRDQLKVSIDRILAMERNEVQTIERIGTLESQVLELTTQCTINSQLFAEHMDVCMQLESKLVQAEDVKPGYNSDNSDDSVGDRWSQDQQINKPAELLKSLSGKLQSDKRANNPNPGTDAVLLAQGQGPRPGARFGPTTSVFPKPVAAQMDETESDAQSVGRLVDGNHPAAEFQHRHLCVLRSSDSAKDCLKNLQNG